MFKRLFFLSGIIAFLLAAATMYFWYLPNQHPAEQSVRQDSIAEPDSLRTEPEMEFAE